jgi:serine phosphatase RsbU (regulator of sigma subunit)
MAKRKKRKPERATICGHEVRINYRDGMPEEWDNEDGNFFPDEQEINVDLTAVRSPDQILLHEMIHAVLEYTGHSQSLDDRQEEAIVSALEQHLIHLVNLKRREPW